MRYKNLTREALDKARTIRPMDPDGVWLDWPFSVEPKKPSKRQAKTSRTARWKVAKSFKPGSGLYS
jgi:hypothetical protein